MSYEVTATRRRPQQFDDLVGQEFVAATLKNSIKSGKIAHAYLFSGPRGCGKTSTARILAKALNCQNGPTDTPCGTCSNCQEIIKGSSLDVIEIDGASNNSVENVRQIKDEIQFPPSGSKYKIYIIDEVHMLSTSAFNALLKTIEEPPEYAVFIFATTELQKVPATIKSRCQQYNFRLVSIDKVKECLAQAAAELNIQADDEALFWIARESTGSMRDAYTLFDQVVAFSDGHITYEKIRDKLGLVGVDRLNTIFESCANGDTTTVINSLDEFLQGGVSIEQLISNCADYLRSLLLIKNGVTKESLLGNAPERYSKIVLEKWNAVQIERALSIYLQLYRDIRYSLSPRYELELSFSRLCWLSQYVSNVEVKKAIDAAKALLSGAPVAQVSPVSASVNSVQAFAPKEEVPAQPASVDFSAVTASEPVSNAKINPIPEGLPRLSMLDELQNEQDENPAQGDESNPFHDGGPLPPQQSVVANEQYQVPVSETGYTENPDEENDGWTNTDTPPEDDYYSEELQAEEAKASFENHQSIENSAESKAPVQLNDFLTTADGNQISVAQLRGSILAELSISDGFMVAVLERTGIWKVTDNKIETTIEKTLDLQILNNNLPLLCEKLQKFCGKPMEFVVAQKTQEENNSVAVEIPQQVQILLDTFKGTIVTGKQ